MPIQDSVFNPPDWVIPGGAHTYSRGADQFPSNAPALLVSGKGSKVFDQNGKEYLDYGMALRAVTLGYCNSRVDSGAKFGIDRGNVLTRPSTIEITAAEQLLSHLPNAEMVKFAKNGSSANTAAIKLARAYTSRVYVCIPKQQPFFSYDDWFIGKTPMSKGCSPSASEHTLMFDYGQIKSLAELFDRYPGQIACVLMEAATSVSPCPESKECTDIGMCRTCPSSPESFARQVEDLCRANDALFILDEIITGFRWHEKGAQFFYGLNPDLSTFGKALANGYSVAALTGRREIMSMAGINLPGAERVFLLSSTSGAEMSSLGAMLGALSVYSQNEVCKHLWSYGRRLVASVNSLSLSLGLDKHFAFEGQVVSPQIRCMDSDGKTSLAFKTLFMQEMTRRGVLMPWLSFSTSHTVEDLDRTLEAVNETLKVYAQALETNVFHFLEGEPVKPVFRKFN